MGIQNGVQVEQSNTCPNYPVVMDYKIHLLTFFVNFYNQIFFSGREKPNYDDQRLA